jgi:rhodanese-related sulfurtransferase
LYEDELNKYFIKPIIMSIRYIILALVLIAVAFGLLFITVPEKSNQIEVTTFLKSINDPARFINTDDVADRIITEDPTLLIIDVRKPAEFEAFNIPGSVNIPLGDLMNEENRKYINQNLLDVVFVSNDGVYANTAWALAAQNGYKNLYVLEGGLNRWFETIMAPVEPAETAPIEEFELFSVRKGAGQYFGVQAYIEAPVIEKVIQKKRAPKKVIVKEVQEVEAEGGC